MLSHVQLFCNPVDYSPPGSSVHGFYRQEYWSGLPFPPPGDLPDPESEPQLLCLLHWQVDSLPLYHLASPKRDVQFSRSVVSDSLRPHESQHARPPCPLPTPGVHSESRPSSQWCHPAISSSVVPFYDNPFRVFSNESILHMRWPKYWSFSFSISPSKFLTSSQFQKKLLR